MAALEGAEYTFDGDNNLVKSEVNGVVTYYLGKYYEKTVQNGHYAETCAECFFSKKHYSAGSSIIAVRTVVDGTQDTLNWLVGDHLGSTSLVTDSSGAVVSEVRYSAFGEMRYLNGETVTDLLYTGQKLDSYINLYWYGSRWYDSALGRFTQADSIIADSVNALSYDRYAYVENNPIIYSDPTGEFPIFALLVLAITAVIITADTPDVSYAPISESIYSAVAPPDYSDVGETNPKDYVPPPPEVDGLPDDKWEWHDSFPNNERGYTNEDDPGYVWSPHKGKGGEGTSEGEAPHWHRRQQGVNRGGQVFPPDYQWGRGGQRSYPGEYNERTGLYESENSVPSFSFEITDSQINQTLGLFGIMAGLKVVEFLVFGATGVPVFFHP